MDFTSWIGSPGFTPGYIVPGWTTASTPPLTDEQMNDAIFRSLIYYLSTEVNGDNTFDESNLFDPSTSPEWVEFTIESMNRGPRRKGSKRFVDVVLTAHIWVKPGGTDLYAANRKVDEVQDIVDQKTVNVKDYFTSGHPTVGAVRFRETQVTDVTPQTEQVSPSAGRHFIITVPGIAQEL